MFIFKKNVINKISINSAIIQLIILYNIIKHKRPKKINIKF